MAEKIEKVLACSSLKEARKIESQDEILKDMDQYLRECVYEYMKK